MDLFSYQRKTQFNWIDLSKSNQLTCANQVNWIVRIMDWIKGQVNGTADLTDDVPFPKKLYRVSVHVYVHHFDRLMLSHKHFYYFIDEFSLINDKESRLKEDKKMFAVDSEEGDTNEPPHLTKAVG